MFSFFKSKKDLAETDETPAKSVVEPESQSEESISFASRLKQGLSRTRQNLGKQLSGLFGGGKIDEELYEELETILLTSDIGVNATHQLLENLRKQVKRDALTDSIQLKQALKESLIAMLEPLAQPLDTTAHKPFVIMITGVNGVGKTTSIGKLAKFFQTQGHSVLLAAGDTFRAAAREQLIAWGERNNVTVIAPDSDPDKKSDPAAVIYDAVNSAKARGIDIVLADTAGRLTTQLHLMEEIKKVKRVIAKAMPDAPHEVLLVLDANTGQNAITQVSAFDDALNVTGLILTKLDGTAKGGVVAAIAGQYPENPPALRFIGVGEGLDDLRPFDAREFVEALLD
ncbi:signal recognition particle-docking protein FtsY [Nitrosomonas ureae]|uniref:Signal recognition particle receptor FtsY n=1 Tax=Nitrosomonas ureae TaxID=44577 RepID=A0A0S3AHT4_9PROT|nr:signal recognition particle-docking protein FtsY [Nitrosomonas ureae]ALQ50724.1 cell division protein FtsY [Nitrosomonas ureae]PTQ86107.1 signal recognition particle-docking protein FtsY [Nitrosomonas ureae]PXX17851.1 signal recognition particle-docking protein FtsY [Nitrosomonas ureae]SDT84234.1 signal recognition particle-docking protein FtsY [Nitrosomonas ureae]SOD18561.1 signal recognition particle-docking protein FtsY [Nitrosomonas ureae]